MNGYMFAASCPRCGGELLTEGYAPTVAAPDLTYIEARCDRCLDVIRITVSTSVIEPWPTNRIDGDARCRESAAAANAYLDTSW